MFCALLGYQVSVYKTIGPLVQASNHLWLYCLVSVGQMRLIHDNLSLFISSSSSYPF